MLCNLAANGSIRLLVREHSESDAAALHGELSVVLIVALKPLDKFPVAFESVRLKIRFEVESRFSIPFAALEPNVNRKANWKAFKL